MIYSFPFLLTTLHPSHIFLTLLRTFIPRRCSCCSGDAPFVSVGVVLWAWLCVCVEGWCEPQLHVPFEWACECEWGDKVGREGRRVLIQRAALALALVLASGVAAEGRAVAVALRVSVRSASILAVTAVVVVVIIRVERTRKSRKNWSWGSYRRGLARPGLGRGAAT